MDNTIIQQGSFTTSGTTAQTVQLRSDVDWFRTYNWTTTAAGGAGTGVEFLWMRGMAVDTGIEYKKLAADESMSPITLASGGFTLVDTSASALGTLNTTITAVSNAATPVVSLTSTAGLSTGDIVRLINVAGATQLNGVDFEIGAVVANTSFPLAYAPQIVAGTTGSLYLVKYQPQYYPRRRFISKITAANPAVITTTVSHGITAGQKFRVIVPSAYGMTQINSLIATAVSVTASTITTDIDASAFTAFAWPLTALGGTYSHAIIVPIGEAATATYQNSLDDATRNLGYIGMKLAYGVDSPAGVDTNLIYWMAGKSFNL
jgi:hypothetical protein